MDLFTIAAALGALTFIFILFSKWRYQYWSRKGVPQLEPKLIFGDFKPLVSQTATLQDFLMDIYKKSKANGWKHVGIYNFLNPELMPLDLKTVKSILLKDFDHFPGHGIYHHEKEPLSENLFNMEGDDWKKLRAKLTPTFTTGLNNLDLQNSKRLGYYLSAMNIKLEDTKQLIFQTRSLTKYNITYCKMKMMFETLAEKANVLHRVLNKSAESNQEIQVKETLARFGTDVIGSVAFGIECNSLEDPDNKLREIGKKAFVPNFLKFLVEEMIPPYILANIGYKSTARDITKYFTEVVSETIKYREENNVERKDFMQLMLQLKNQGGKGSVLTNQEIITESYLFYLAGFETSSTATSFALLELSQNQDVQDKLRKEIHEVLKENGGKINYDVVMQMEYLDRVLHEALRKYPPLAFIPRLCSKTYKIPGSDVVIEKGTRVYIPAWGIQKDPEYYPNPEQFNPDNFSPENKAKRPDFTWMPFGEGPRMCIGLRFGMMQAKVGLITLLRDFKYSPKPNTKWPLEMEFGSIVLSASGEPCLKIEKL